MTVYLIRHGKTEANERHLYCGSTDIGLSPAGAAALRALHYDVGDACFVTSGMRRANETLELLFGNVPYREEPRFREVDFGVFEMKSYEQLKGKAEYQTWLTGDNEANVPPGGESGWQMGKRALEAYREIGRDTVIVTHGGCIAAIMSHLFPGENKNRYQWQSEPGRGYAISENTYRRIP